MKQPGTKTELAAYLRTLAARAPVTRPELFALERDCVSLALHLQNSRAISDIPEVVWHFLSDPDVRFKSPEYAQDQLAALASALEEMEQHA